MFRADNKVAVIDINILTSESNKRRVDNALVTTHPLPGISLPFKLVGAYLLNHRLRYAEYLKTYLLFINDSKSPFCQC